MFGVGKDDSVGMHYLVLACPLDDLQGSDPLPSCSCLWLPDCAPLPEKTFKTQEQAGRSTKWGWGGARKESQRRLSAVKKGC